MLGSDSVFEWVVYGIRWIRGIAATISEAILLPVKYSPAAPSLPVARQGHDLVGGGLAKNRKGPAGKYPPGGGIRSKPFSAQAQYSYLRNEHHPSAALPLVLAASNSALSPVDGLRASRRKGGPSESSGNGSDSEKGGG